MSKNETVPLDSIYQLDENIYLLKAVALLALDNHVEAVCKHSADCGHEQNSHGDHTDYLVNVRLQHIHEDHVDDRGTIEVL